MECIEPPVIEDQLQTKHQSNSTTKAGRNWWIVFNFGHVRQVILLFLVPCRSACFWGFPGFQHLQWFVCRMCEITCKYLMKKFSVSRKSDWLLLVSCYDADSPPSHILLKKNPGPETEVQLGVALILLTKIIWTCTHIMLYISHREKWSESSTPHAPRPKRPGSTIQLQQANLHDKHHDGGKYHSKLRATVFFIIML